MKIRKRDRMSIYRQLIRVLINRKSRGFCIALINIEKYNVSMSDLPELIAFKPIKCYKKTTWWFNPENYKTRINILETILKENTK